MAEKCERKILFFAHYKKRQACFNEIKIRGKKSKYLVEATVRHFPNLRTRRFSLLTKVDLCRFLSEKFPTIKKGYHGKLQ